MTIICAVKKDNQVVIGADSFWGSNYYTSKKDNSSKLIVKNNFIVGISGISVLKDLIEEMSFDYEVNSKSSARHFGKEVYRLLKEEFDSGVKNKDELKDGGFIIATRKSIFTVQKDCSCMEESMFDTTGAGWELCAGAIQALYDKEDYSAFRIVRESLAATCKLSPLCSEPLEIRSL